MLVSCPAPEGVWTGNRTTAERWTRMLRSLGCRVSLQPSQTLRPLDGFDLLVALHARRSAEVLHRFKERFPERPAIVGLAGTDVYGDLPLDPAARRSVDLADRLVALQPEALRQIDPGARNKTRVVYQSARRSARAGRRDGRWFDVAVVAHLREVKDPLRTARAVRDLPRASRIRVLHVGAGLAEDLARSAREEMAMNPRYRWLGQRSPAGALALLRRCRLLSLTSVFEGGANVVSEAIVAGVPLVASRIAGNTGLLGARYPGLFAVGDTAALRRLLLRAESEPAFYRRLAAECARRAPLFRPARERAAWRALLSELGLPPVSRPKRTGAGG